MLFYWSRLLMKIISCIMTQSLTHFFFFAIWMQYVFNFTLSLWHPVFCLVWSTVHRGHRHPSIFSKSHFPCSISHPCWFSCYLLLSFMRLLVWITFKVTYWAASASWTQLWMSSERMPAQWVVFPFYFIWVSNLWDGLAALVGCIPP